MKGKKKGIRFSGKALELGRKHLYREEFVPLLLKYLDIKPGQRIVDVGCGTGFSSRLVARALDGKGEVIGLDRNEQLLRHARRLTRESGLESLISFRKDATKLGLKDNFADRVICQAMLWTMQDPRKALREMVRVCRPGGKVCAIEFASDTIHYFYPGNPRLTRLERKANEAEARGYMKLEGLDRNVGYKVPSLFQELGLKKISLDAYAHVWLDLDDRISLDHKMEIYKFELYWMKREKGLSLRQRRILKADGMNDHEIDEYADLYRRHLEKVTSSKQALRESSSVNTGILFITTGVKG